MQARFTCSSLLAVFALSITSEGVASGDEPSQPAPTPVPSELAPLPDPAAPTPAEPALPPSPTAPAPPPPSTEVAPPASGYVFPPPSGIFEDGAIPRDAVEPFFHASFGVDWLRQVPRLSLGEVAGERAVRGQTLPSVGSLAMWRLQLGADLIVWKRMVVPILGIAAGGALGPVDRVVTTADGSFVESRPWTTWNMTFLGPGAGIRLTQRRWTVSGTARVALTYLWMDASVVTGRQVSEVVLDRFAAAIRLDAEVCRRVGPLDRACLYVETRAYDATAFNGGSVGLRWEFGR